MVKARTSSILDSWPALKNDILSFLSDTDAWIIAELKKARETNDWERVGKVIDVMKSVHDISQGHHGG